MWGIPMHRRTQDFTMEGVHVVGSGQGIWESEVSPWSPGAKP